MDFQNIKYLVATTPEAAFAAFGVAALLVAGVIAPLVYVLVPMAKMVITIGALGV